MHKIAFNLALICLTLCAGVIPTRADLQLQSKMHAVCRPAYATTYKVVGWKPRDTCSDDCFVSRLTCSNGKTHELRSAIHPGTTKFQFAFRTWAPWSFIGYLLPFIAFVAIATVGSARPAPLLILNALFLTFATSAAWSLYASITGNPSSDSVQLERTVLLNPYVYGAIIGVFAMVNLRPALRGLEYFLYRYSADDVIIPTAFTAHPAQALSPHATLMPNLYEFVDPRETASYYRRETDRLHALKEKLDAETAFAQAFIRRERAHNELRLALQGACHANKA